MPEPVVIIGPAAGPAGPVVRSPSDPENAAPEAEPDEAQDTVAGPSVGRRILGFALSLLGRVAKAFASVLIYLIREYPRHSLAAGASVVILGAILYSQSGSASGRAGVTNAISGNGKASLQPAVSKLPGSEPATEVAAAPAPAPKSGPAEQGATAAADPPKPPAPDTKESKAPPGDLAAQSPPPAPKAESTQNGPAPTTDLAQTNTAEKTAAGAEPAPSPSTSSPDPAGVPLPPPASDTAKATLLAGDLGPAPAGDQAAKTKATPDVPPDLWLPEAAPKPGANDDGKAAKTGETAIAAAPSGESKPPGEPKNADDSAGKPAAPTGPPSGESSPVTIPAPASPTPLPVAPQVPKPDTKAESPAPAPSKVVEPPISAPQGGDAPEGDKKPVLPAQESAFKPADSSAPPPAPSAESLTSGSEKTPGNLTGPGAQSSPAPSPAKEEPVPEVSPATERERDHVASAETAAPAQTATEPKVEASGAKALPEAGWIVIPNSGKVPLDPTESPTAARAGSSTLDGSEAGNSAGNLGAHAARDVAFEPEPSQSRGTRQPAVEPAAGDGRRAPGAAAPQPRAASHSERVEATEHLVQSRENYWTISKQYFGSGRYYRALWKANEAKHPNIDVLHVNDVIIVPDIQDLDPDLIDPPSAPGRSVSLAAASPPRPRNQRIRQDEEAGSAEQTFKRKDAPNSGVFDGNVDETESRTSARPRPGGTAPGRPVYRVRPYDTLRSIARDTLGSSRRADEVLDLNRGLIDDPNQLVVGQVLELPDDAKTTIRRPAKR
jgi:hypothetical protein